MIKLADDVQVAVPTWMLDPLACQQLTDEDRPRVSVAALNELRGLLDSQPFLVTMLVTNQRGSQHAGGDDAQPHRASTAATNADVRPTRTVADTPREGSMPMQGIGGTPAASGASGRGSNKERG